MARSGWTWPRGRARPGSVTSIRSRVSDVSSRARREGLPSGVEGGGDRVLHLVRERTHRRTLVCRSCPSSRSTAFSDPLRPRYLSRIASSASSPSGVLDLGSGRLA
jgi:hypothetical protein